MSYLKKYTKIKNELLNNGIDSIIIQNNIDFYIDKLNELNSLIHKSTNKSNSLIKTSLNRENIMDQMKTKNLLQTISSTKEFLNDILSEKYDNYTRITPIQLFLDSLNDFETYFDLIDQIK